MMSNLERLQKKIRLPLMITDQPNLYYLSGFTGSSGVLVISKKQAWFFTDPRYSETAAKQISDNIEIIELDKKDPDAFKKFLKSSNIPRLTFESSKMSVEEYGVLKQKLGSTIYITNEEFISALREIKSEKEIKLIKKACGITTRIFKELKKNIKLNMTEKDLVWEITRLNYELGGDKLAFDPIVAFGKNTSIPHHQPSNTRLKKNSPIQLDFGAEIKGYKSDMSRVIFFGEPNEKMKELYEVVLEMQKKAVESVRPKKNVSTLAKKFVSKTYLRDSDDYLVSHGLGHGVGLDIHESPSLKPNSDDRLKLNQVITIEPGIYVENIGGIRIEDTLVVTEKGVKVLTNAPKSLNANLIKV